MKRFHRIARLVETSTLSIPVITTVVGKLIA
jgi:hypothetical protein